MGGEVLPDVVWLEMGVKIAQERPVITLPDVDLTRHVCSSSGLDGHRHKEKPQAPRPGARMSWTPFLEGYIATR